MFESKNQVFALNLVSKFESNKANALFSILMSSESPVMRSFGSKKGPHTQYSNEYLHYKGAPAPTTQ